VIARRSKPGTQDPTVPNAKTLDWVACDPGFL